MSATSPPAAMTSPESASSHPLQYKWTLWHDVSAGRRGTYAQNLCEISSFDTVEDFWGLFGNLKPPSELSVGHTYNLFKYSIEPKWEDPQNTSGGEWRLTVSVSLKSMIEDVWLLTVMNVIGEQFSQEQSEDITGIVINIKRNEIRLAIWTKTSRNRHLQEKLGQEWKQLTGIQMRIVYLFFEDVETSGRNARARYLA